MRVLLVKLTSLGDVVQTWPVVADLVSRFPGVQIDWVVEEAFADLLAQVQGLDRVIPCPQRRLRKTWWSRGSGQEWRAFRLELRREAYDAVLDLQGLVKSAWVARQARLSPQGFSATYGNRSELCGYERAAKWLLDRGVFMEAKIHAIQRTRHLAARALGYDPGSLGPAVYPLPARGAQAGRGLFFAHGTTRPENEWPDGYWLEVAERWIALRDEPVILPHADDRELARAESWARQLGSGARVLPRMRLPELMGIMRDSAAMVSVDSGLGHLGVANGVPLVMLFSQPRVERAGPQGQAHQVALGGERTPQPGLVWQSLLSCLAAERAD